MSQTLLYFCAIFNWNVLGYAVFMPVLAVTETLTKTACVLFVRYIMMNFIKNMKSWSLCLATVPSKSMLAAATKVS